MSLVRKLALGTVCTVCAYSVSAQEGDADSDLLRKHDSLYISEIEDGYGKDKVLHAEPLYIDLIRDLGARKGEREWNFGLGIVDNEQYDVYSVLVEYEFAPMDRLGLEVELPFSFYMPLGEHDKESAPSDRLESLKTAIQWTFLVSPKHNTSLAVGYINEVIFNGFKELRSESLVAGNKFNPFLVAAKRWGQNFHTLIYTGMHVEKMFGTQGVHTYQDVNTNIHYMIPGTRNFIGVEFNKVFNGSDFDMTVRPQLRLAVSKSILVGIVGGIPISRENERLSSFVRLIWEPGHNAMPLN